MPPRKPAAKWESEAAMLSAFMELMRSWGFRVLPECCGHDLLLVVPEDGLSERKPEMLAPWERRSPAMKPYSPADDPAWDCLVPGDVIAVEGKLHATATLLRQITPPYRRRWNKEGGQSADFYVGLLPTTNGDFADVARALGATTWVFTPPGYRWQVDMGPDLWEYGCSDDLRCYGAPLDLPKIDIDIVPGRSAPERVTTWKISAVRFCLEFRDKAAESADFNQHNMSARLFVDHGWARKIERTGSVWSYELLDVPTRPDRRYPEVAKAVSEQGHRLTQLPHRERVIITEEPRQQPQAPLFLGVQL